MSRWIQYAVAAMLLGSHVEAAPPRLLPTEEPPAGYPEPWYEDAALWDLSFVDAEYGWTVGDRGVIWHTSTGGAEWRRQTSMVDCQLTSVHFVDRQHGWAVGGHCHPLTQRSEGVLLQTADGGENWESIPGLLLPWLTAVHFTTRQQGIVVGNATALNPSGAFATLDGGRTWVPISGVAGAHWSAASFQGDAALLVDHRGRPARISNGRLQLSGSAEPAGHVSNHWFTSSFNSKIGFVGDDQSSLQLTVDGGTGWTPVQAPLAGFHPRTMSLAGHACWLAGTPGTQVLVSQDHSKSWLAGRTGATLPINKSYFIDARRGWLVGAYGLILATDDGGEHWKSQRGGGKRAAMLGIFARHQDIPWQWLGAIAAADGFRVHIAVLGQPREDLLLCPPEQRLADAAMRIGASSEILTGLPIPEDDLNLSATEIIRRWEEPRPGTLEEVSARLTGLIRTWRPDVVVTTAVADEEELGIRSITNQLVADACELSAGETAFPEQLSAGLLPWLVARPLALHQADDRGGFDRGDSLVAGLGKNVAEIATRAGQLMGLEDPPRGSCTLAYLEAAKRTSSPPSLGSNPLGGLPIPFGTASRRPRIVAENAAEGKRIQRRHLHARNLLLSDFANTASRLEQAERLLANLDEEFAGNVLWELSRKLQQTGDLAGAEQVYRRLIAQYPRHPLSDYALSWLVGFHCSSELRLRQRRQADGNQTLQLATAELPELPGQSQTMSSSAVDEAEQIAIELARQLESKRPDLYGSPQIAFSVASAMRAAGQANRGKAIYQRLVALPDESRWRHRAAVELALCDPAAKVGLTEFCWSCGQFSDRPQLDGDLSDACWQQATTQRLVSQQALPEPSTTVRFGHDDEFFYFAAECEKQEHTAYPPTRRPRPRDANLENSDRLRFNLDIDRDYGSWWEFTIDHRGWTHESVWGDKSWDPEYFVASTDDETRWVIEVAIPLEELARPTQRSGTAWLMSCERIIPKDRIQAWSTSGSSPDRAREAVLLME